MKIAILTLPLYSNYGGIMQNYALQTILKRMGHHVYTIDCPQIYKNKLWYNIYINKCKYIIKRILTKLGMKVPMIDNSSNSQFIQSHIMFTSTLCPKKNNLSNLNYVGLNAIIVGSDQVWRYPYIQANVENFFLDFIHDDTIIKIAYSASFGVNYNEYPAQIQQKIKKLYSKFNRVSVREKSGLDLLEKNGWKCTHPALITLDPTLLLNQKDYNALIEQNNSSNEHTSKKIFCYILDKNDEKRQIINSICEATDYEPIMLNIEHKNKQISIPSVKLWIRSFRDADFVFTDSFHGCVFSIIYNKPFIVIANKKRGLTRFETLLNLFKLEDRIIYSKSDLKDDLFHKKINWEEIEAIKNNKRKEAIEFLKSGLNSNNNE